MNLEVGNDNGSFPNGALLLFKGLFAPVQVISISQLMVLLTQTPIVSALSPFSPLHELKSAAGFRLHGVPTPDNPLRSKQRHQDL